MDQMLTGVRVDHLVLPSGWSKSSSVSSGVSTDQVPGEYVTSGATWKATSAEDWQRDGIYWVNTNIMKSAAKSSDVKVESFMS